MPKTSKLNLQHNIFFAIGIVSMLIVMQIVVLFSKFTVVSVYADPLIFTCTSIQFFTNDAATTPVTFPLTLALDSNGNIVPKTVTVHITAQGPQDYSPTADYQLSYQHQQFSGGAWNWNHISFAQTLNPGTNQWDSVAHMTFDREGTWYYSFETTAQRHVDGSGAGCARTDGGRSVISTVTATPNPNQSYDRSCAALSEAQMANHFACQQISSTPTVLYEAIGAESYCEAGYEIANETCRGNTTLTAANYCLPCLLIGRNGNNTTVGHLEICDSTHVCDATLVQTDEAGARHNLACTTSTAPSDQGSSGTIRRCVFDGRVVQQGGECLVSSTECRVKDSNNFYAMECVPDSAGNFRGRCNVLTDSCMAGSNASDAICVRYFNDHNLPNANNAFCNPETGTCAPGASRSVIITPPVTPLPPPPESTEYGSKNCPYSGSIITRPSGMPDDVWARLQASASQSAGLTQEQRDEHNNCVTCIDGGNTWTAIGCINTSVAGVFTTLVRIALGVMGGVVLLRMIYLGYLYQTGDTKKIEEAKAGVMSTIAGIIVVVFSVVILRVVGVNLLDIVPAGFFGS